MSTDSGLCLMEAMGTPLQNAVDGIELLAEGKVREIYDIGYDYLVLHATDRISAFDVVMKTEIPEKGAILTSLTEFWLKYLSQQIPGLQTHLVKARLPNILSGNLNNDDLLWYTPRSMVVKCCEVFPIESIVRGYLTGSAWVSYQKTGEIHGIELPKGLRESEKLEEPLWTPSTKAEKGAKDENIHPAKARQLIGASNALEIERISLQLYEAASSYAASRGIIIADTKFEFGLDKSVDPPRITLIDEVLTPDSSRFWNADTYEVGKRQDSYDKQPLRDWLVRKGLEGRKDVEIPDDIVKDTRQRYLKAYTCLTGKEYRPPQESDALSMQGDMFDPTLI